LLFSGIGGFELAIHSVFPNAECVGYSEIDKYAIKTYRKHFIGGQLELDL
jgi:site-specific DNA-cytosine methylase